MLRKDHDEALVRLIDNQVEVVEKTQLPDGDMNTLAVAIDKLSTLMRLRDDLTRR